MKTLFLSCMLFVSLSIMAQQPTQELKLSPEVEASLTEALKALEKKISTADLNTMLTKEEWNAFQNKYEGVVLDLENSSVLKDIFQLDERQKAEFKTLKDVVIHLSTKKEKVAATDFGSEEIQLTLVDALEKLEKSETLKYLLVDFQKSEVLKELMTTLASSELVKVLTVKK